MKTKKNLWGITTFSFLFIILFLNVLLRNSIHIYGDGITYYQYFTQIFIQHNFWDNEIIKYPAGTTLLQLPFLLVALLVSTIFKLDLQNGYSLIFQKAVLLSASFYCFLGLFFIYSIVKKYYSDKIASLVCLSLMLGSLLYYYSLCSPSYSHIYSFFACALFVFFTIQYEENYSNLSKIDKLKYDLILGATLALACIIRYTNSIIILFYVLYQVNNFEMFKKRLNVIFSKKIFYQFIFPIVLLLFQVVLYKILMGNFLLIGYNDESFTHLLNPQIYKVLFSVNKGLFVFCPILFVGFLSIFLPENKCKEFKFAHLSIFIIQTYLIASWWGWWLGFGYTERMYCDILCVFSLPLANFFQVLSNLKKRNKILFSYLTITTILFICINLIFIKGVNAKTIDGNFASANSLKKEILNTVQLKKSF